MHIHKSLHDRFFISWKHNVLLSMYYRIMYDFKSQHNKSWGIEHVLLVITKPLKSVNQLVSH